MSLAATRAAIAAAAADVDDVTGYPARPAVPRPGDAWVMWAGAERDAGFLFVHTWRLIVVLAADEHTADAMNEEWSQALASAVEDAGAMYVDAIAPTVLATQGGDLYALTLTGRTE